MAGGNLRSALDKDEEAGNCGRRQLSWYKYGRNILICVAQGLTYLHSQRVSAISCVEGRMVTLVVVSWQHAGHLSIHLSPYVPERRKLVQYHMDG